MSRSVLYRGRKVDLEIHRVRYADGHVVERETLHHPGAVAVVPLLDAETVCLIRNQRFAIGRTLVEVPAGTLEPGESPAACAARELAEETGYRAGRVEPLCRFYTSPGILDEEMHVFLAADLTHVGQALEPTERIEVAPTPWSDALAMIADGRIADAKSIAALLFYRQYRAAR